MPRSKFVITSEVPQSFRAQKVQGMFDYEKTTVEKAFDVDIPIEGTDWNVGLIVGSSGSGKTTIARRVFEGYSLFQGFAWNADCVLDDFSDELSADQIVEALCKVGFSSPPDWLKPFDVLSNGQKMRVELARLVLETDEPCLYDEFTSVVDRQVAQIGSAAIQKFIRKAGKQFIAISCHRDVEPWLEPDWVYDVDKNAFRRGCLRRPKIAIDVRKAEQVEWRDFVEFHYLSSAHNKSAEKYIAEYNGVAVAWCSVLHFPHSRVKNLKKLHRTVVRPDYQGVGIGARLTEQVAQRYVDEGFRVSTVTGNPARVHSCAKSPRWRMTRKPGRTASQGKTASRTMSNSGARVTASFEYVSR